MIGFCFVSMTFRHLENMQQPKETFRDLFKLATGTWVEEN